MKTSIESKISYFVLISIICTFDQTSKFLIKLFIPQLSNKDLILFNIELVRNYGAAFNILSGSRLFLSFISIISSIILFYFIFISENKLINKYSLSFILAGSIGNGIDRILNGYVIDFIKIKYIDFPVFNIADVSINIGVILLIIIYFRDKS
tara:strand:- start:303 stop:758 length:456 start_codon:yes stop_codon:yes gene_type:complete